MRSHIHQYTGRSLHHATLNTQSALATLRDGNAQGSVQQLGLHWQEPAEREHQARAEQCGVLITQRLTYEYITFVLIHYFAAILLYFTGIFFLLTCSSCIQRCGLHSYSVL